MEIMYAIWAINNIHKQDEKTLLVNKNCLWDDSLIPMKTKNKAIRQFL